MHRAVVLTTLVLLLLAVAGVSAAQDSGIFAGEPNSDDSPGLTTQERTSFEATMAEDTMKSALPGASSEPKAGEAASEPTVVTEPTVGETEKPTAAAPGEKTLTPGSNNVGKPEYVGKAPKIGKPPDGVVGHTAKGEPQERGNEVEHGRGGGQQKVTLCHKDKKTLTVGAPAQAAHLRHGDSVGAC
jgi:outer membrane biosynthesis protein TonB